MFSASSPKIYSGSSAGGQAGANVSTTLTVTQAGHGFTGNELLYNSAGTYTLALATAATTLAQFWVAQVVDINTFVISEGAFITSVAHGLGTAGKTLYLSQSVAGASTTTMPTSGIVQEVGQAENSDVYSSHIWPATAT